MNVANELFKISLTEFESRFPEKIDCIKWLSDMKWVNGFVCHFCKHTHYCSGQHLGALRCAKCKHEESVKAHTIFNNCKLPLKTAIYMMLFAYNNPDITTSQMCNELGIRKMTCWRMKKLVTLLTNNKYEKISN